MPRFYKFVPPRLSLWFAEHSSNSLDRQRTNQWSKTLFGKRRYNLLKSIYMYLYEYISIRTLHNAIYASSFMFNYKKNPPFTKKKEI